jgi:hypothetical protein
MRIAISLIVALSIAQSTMAVRAAELEFIKVAPDGNSFVLAASGKPFTPWGFNYDHDPAGRLLEDYWDDEWKTVAEDFQEMKDLGANVVRIHLQLGKFMKGADEPNQESLALLAKLIALAEEQQLYLDLTGLGCYHKRDVPAWYDALDEAGRWKVQAKFWESVAARCNEPVVPGGGKKQENWLGPAFGDKHFVQFITREPQDRPRPEIAKAWIDALVAAIRKHDQRHLITVGLVDWSLQRKGLTSGFPPEKVADKLDFIAVHIYPQAKELDEALATLAGFDIGKPIVIEEMFPLKCTSEELDTFISRSKKHADGWIGFYWGKRPEEYRAGKTFADAVTLQWLELFQAKRNEMLMQQ